MERARLDNGIEKYCKGRDMDAPIAPEPRNNDLSSLKGYQFFGGYFLSEDAPENCLLVFPSSDAIPGVDEKDQDAARRLMEGYCIVGLQTIAEKCLASGGVAYHHPCGYYSLLACPPGQDCKQMIG